MRTAALVRPRSRATAALVTVLGLAAGLLTVLPGTARVALADDRGPAPVAADAVSAATAARAAGRPVEVLSARTEREQTFANPDGSFRWEQSIEPRRVRRADGSWAAVDTGLKAVGGWLRPAAAAADVRFSTGGTGPFAVLTTPEGRLALSWPGALPAPRVDGDTAVYAGVLPGVDLRVRATVEGFSHVLVVKDRQAAASPALRQVRFGLTAGDLVLRPTHDGLEARGPGGALGVTAGQALMWDSRGRDGAEASSARLAGGAARQLALPATVDGGDLVLTPDRALLDDPATVYPVYVDPGYSKGKKRWGFTDSANENNDDSAARVGKSPDSGALYRSSFVFDVTALKGKRILSATFSITLIHSWACTSTPVNAYRGPAPAAGRVAWSGPSLSAWIDERSAHAHKPGGGAGCGDDPQPDVPMEFGGNLRSDLQGGATAGWSEYALILAARQSDGSGESTASWWKRFNAGTARLSAVYNSAPTTPTNLSAEARGCGTGATRPVLSTVTPKLRAVVHDPDGDEGDLKGSFAWEKWDTSVTPNAWKALGSGSQSNLTPNGTAQIQITSGLANAGIYRWRVQTLDPYSYAGLSGTDSSAWSGWCEFSVDTVGPQTVPAVSSPVYGTDIDRTYGAVGLTANFTFAANGVTDVSNYLYGWEDPPTTSVATATPGGSVTLPVTPPSPAPANPERGGLTTLYVISMDRAGHPSPVNEYTFNLGSATSPLGQWNLDDPTGSATAADTSTRGALHPATFTNAVPGAAGRILNGPGRAAPAATSFNGTNSKALTSGPVLDTSRSFTVSAWARVTDTSKYDTVISQDGSQEGEFRLQYRLDRNAWCLSMRSQDVYDAPLQLACAAVAAKPRTWTHLVGVYDAGAAGTQAKLYVDGVKAAETAFTTPWAATGIMAIGRAKVNVGVAGDYFAGDIAEVKVWDRAVTPEEIASMPASLVGRWRLDGDGTDATDFHRDAAIEQTPLLAWGEDRFGTPESAVIMGGTFDEGDTAGPVIRTDQSFTVSAWVQLESVPTRDETAVSQDGTKLSGFFLGTRMASDGKPHWSFSLKDTDSDAGAAGVTWDHAMSTPITDDQLLSWVHLTGVYDTALDRITLYVTVDGTTTAYSAVRTTPWNAGGRFAIGRSLYSAAGGAPLTTDFWPWMVDDVRAYSGALTPSEAARLAQS
jgi:hypothetical protein